MIPGMIIFYSRQNAWLALLLGTLVTIGGVMLILTLVKQFPGQTVAQYAQTLLGSWLGKSVGFFYALISLYNVAICIRIIAQLFSIAIMPETPLWPFVLGLDLLAIYSAWLGIEPIARANELGLPFSLLVLVILLLVTMSQGKLYQALPVWQFNGPGILEGTFVSGACLSEVFFILLLAPAINKPDELKSATLKGLLLSGLFLMIITQTIIFVLGVYRASAYLFPLLRVVQELLILDIFERFEPLLVSVWIIVNSIKMSLFVYLFALAATQTMNLKNYRPLLLPALIVILILALAPKSLAEVLQIWVNLIAFKILLPTAFILLPGLLLIIAKVKKHHA